MNESLFRKLQEKLDTMSLGFPAAESGADQKILKRLFTDREAELFLAMGPEPEPIEAVSEKIGADVETTQPLVNAMVEKGTLFFMNMEDKKLYMPAPFAHGFFEASAGYMDEELAGYFEQFFRDEYYILLRDMPNGMGFRIAPVNESVSAGSTILPNDDAVEIIKSKSKIAVYDCVCKVQDKLLGNPTDKPVEVCFAFDWLADYVAERKQGRYVSLEEALDIQKKCEEAGLINNVTNIKDSPAMCHCCKQCLGIRAVKDAPKPAEIVVSNYFAAVNESLCSGCEQCVDLCQIDALSMGEDDLVVINLDRCIGCGVCVGACPEKALFLKEKSEKARDPIDVETLAQQIARYRGRTSQGKLFH